MDVNSPTINAVRLVSTPAGSSHLALSDGGAGGGLLAGDHRRAFKLQQRPIFFAD